MTPATILDTKAPSFAFDLLSIIGSSDPPPFAIVCDELHADNASVSDLVRLLRASLRRKELTSIAINSIHTSGFHKPADLAVMAVVIADRRVSVVSLRIMEPRHARFVPEGWHTAGTIVVWSQKTARLLCRRRVVADVGIGIVAP